MVGREGLREALIKALRAEGGEATLDRLRYMSKTLQSLRLEDVLEMAREDDGLEVERVNPYPFRDDVEGYWVVRLREVEECEG